MRPASTSKRRCRFVDVPHAATRWHLYGGFARGKQAGRRQADLLDASLKAPPCPRWPAAQLPTTVCCMLCRLTSDVDAAKADVTKAQKDVEAEKKLKLEANAMHKASRSVLAVPWCARREGEQ